MPDLYRIMFKGQIAVGAELMAVKAALQKLTGYDTEAVEQLFSRSETVLKGGIDKATADRYQAAIQSTGAVCTVEPMPGSVGPGGPALQAPAQKPFYTQPAKEVTCPKCGVRQPDGISCNSCGIIYAKFNQSIDRMYGGGGTPVASEPFSPVALAFKIILITVIGLSLWWLNFPGSGMLPADATVNQKEKIAYKAPEGWLTVTPENTDKVLSLAKEVLTPEMRALLNNKSQNFAAISIKKDTGGSFGTNFNINVIDTKGRDLPPINESSKEQATSQITKELSSKLGNYNLLDSKIISVDGLNSLQITGETEMTFITSQPQPIYETGLYGMRRFRGYTPAVRQTQKLQMIQTVIPGKGRGYVFTFTFDPASEPNGAVLNNSALEQVRVLERPQRFNKILMGALNGALLGAAGYLLFALFSKLGKR
jgi:hypothetical protein